MGKTYLQGDVLTAADLNASLSEAVNTTGSFTFTGVHVHNANLWAKGVDGGFRVIGPSALQSFRTDEATSPYNLINGMDDIGIYYYSTDPYGAGRSFRWRRADNNGVVRDYLSLDRDGNLTSSNTVSDQIGNLRRVPLKDNVTTGYVPVALDSGKTLSFGGAGSLTIPSGVFTSGDTITILNRNTGTAITIIQGTGLTMYWTGQAAATSGNRTLGLLGMCTILFVNSTQAFITGSGLT